MAFMSSSFEKLTALALAPYILPARYTASAPAFIAPKKDEYSPAGESNSTILTSYRHEKTA